jgi:aspartyl protease family protein
MKRWILLFSWIAIASPAVAESVSLKASGAEFTTDVVLNSRLTVRALIDLGATTVVVCERTAREIGLPRGKKVVLRTVGGRLTAHRTHVNVIRMGPIEVVGVEGVILRDDRCEQVLLGMAFLRRLHLMMEGDTLVLSQTHSQPRMKPREE